jgi:hypothetical protein
MKLHLKIPKRGYELPGARISLLDVPRRGSQDSVEDNLPPASAPDAPGRASLVELQPAHVIVQGVY